MIMSMVEAVCSALGDEMERDERVIVLGEDVGKSGGVFRATDGLQKRFGAERVVDTPVSEAAIVGASIGLATAGLVPVPELQFLGFSLQAFHQIGHQLARWRYRTNGRYHAQVTIRAPYGGGVRTPELHSDGFEAIFAQMPGLKMVAPATAADAKGMLLSAIRDPDPVLFLEPLRGYRLVRDEVPDGDVTVPLGSARIARPGSDVTLVAWSAMTTVCLEAASAAAEVGHRCRGDRRALAGAPRHGDDRRFGEPHRARRGGAGGAADGRVRLRGRRRHPGGGVPQPRGADRARVGLGRALSDAAGGGPLRAVRRAGARRDPAHRGVLAMVRP